MAGKAEKVTAVVHEFMDGVTVNERRRSLFSADKVYREQHQEATENRPWQNFTERNSWDGDRLRSECVDYRLSHEKASRDHASHTRDRLRMKEGLAVMTVARPRRNCTGFFTSFQRLT
jgi:hypothetical protein